MKKLDYIAYNKLEGKSPTVVFLSGFKSSMDGTKAVFLESVCREIGHAFVRFDYFGHGKSDGDFEAGTIGQWKNDALKIIDELTDGPLILVGSSMGGWIMLLAALVRPLRIKALLGIAVAPDFTEELIWEKFTKDEQRQIMDNSRVMINNCYDDQEPYPITKNLIEDGRKNLLLLKTIPLLCPIQLTHGMQDEDVPYETSIRLAEKLESNNVEIHLVKNGTHSMSESENLELLKSTLLGIISG